LAKISGRHIEDWLNDLDDLDKYTRATALETLSDAILDDLDLLDLLMPHFKRKLLDKSSLVQMTAIESLGKVSKRRPELVSDTIPTLKDFLKVQDRYIREGTLELIGEIGSREPIAKILSTDSPLAFNDLQKFTNFMQLPIQELRKKILPLLASKFSSLLVDPDNSIRNQTMDLITTVSSKDLTFIRELIPFLIEKLADESIVSSVIQSLIELLPLIREAIRK